MTRDKIPTVEVYRGVPIHDMQSQARIDQVVKPAIDAVFQMRDHAELLAVCADATKPPEARLLAAALLEAAFQIAAAERLTRPAVDLEYVRACVAALDSRGARSPYAYESIYSPGPAPGTPGPDERPEPYRSAVERDCSTVK